MSTPLEVQEVDQIDYEELARTELEEQVVAFLDTLEGETVDNFADTFVRDFVRSFAFVKERESDKIGLKGENLEGSVASMAVFEGMLEDILKQKEQFDWLDASMIEEIALTTMIVDAELDQQQAEVQAAAIEHPEDWYESYSTYELINERGHPLREQMQHYISQDEEYESVEALSSSIDDLWSEMTERMLGDLDLPPSTRQNMTTGLSIFLMNYYAQTEEKQRDKLFAGAQSIDSEGGLRGIIARGKSIGFKNIMLLTQLADFFGQIGDEKVINALDGQQLVSSEGAVLGVKNHILENPYEMYSLLNQYFAAQGDEQEGMVTRAIVGASGEGFQPEKIDITTATAGDTSTTQLEVLQQISVQAGQYMDTETFGQLMNYVEQGNGLVEKADGIRQQMLSSEGVKRTVSWIEEIESTIVEIGAMFGEDWSESGFFDFVDSVFRFFGFDGREGYLIEEYTGGAIDEAFAAYIEDHSTHERSSAADTFAHIYEDLTRDSTDTIKQAGELMDLDKLYAHLNTTSSSGFTLLSSEALAKLLPAELDTSGMSLKEQFAYATAFVRERMVQRRRLVRFESDGDLANPHLSLKYLMMFLVNPSLLGEYHIDISDAHEKLPPGQPATVTAGETPPESAPPVVDGGSPPAGELPGAQFETDNFTSGFLDPDIVQSVDASAALNDCSLNSRKNLEVLTSDGEIPRGDAIGLIDEALGSPVPPRGRVSTALTGLRQLDVTTSNRYTMEQETTSRLQRYAQEKEGTIFDLYVRKEASGGDVNSGHRFVCFLAGDGTIYALDPSRAGGGDTSPKPLDYYLPNAGYQPTDEFYISETVYQPVQYVA